MKNISIGVLIILIFSTCVYSSARSRYCKDGKNGPDIWDYTVAIAGSTVAVGIPVGSINYSMYKDGRNALIYLTDGLLIASLAVIFIENTGKIANEENAGLSVGGALLIGDVLFSFGYSLVSTIEGASIHDDGRVSRGAWGMILLPIGLAAAASMINNYNCRPLLKNESTSVYPVVGPDYAGIDCEIKF